MIIQIDLSQKPVKLFHCIMLVTLLYSTCFFRERTGGARAPTGNFIGKQKQVTNGKKK